MHRICEAAKDLLKLSAIALALSPLALLAEDVKSPYGFAYADAWINERLSYVMYYKGLPTARALISLKQQNGRYIAELTVRTRPMFDSLFKINNIYRTVFDREGLYRVDKRIDQKNIRQDLVIDYDRTALRAQADNGISWPIQPQCTQLLAMLYELRGRNPQAGEKLSFLLDVESQLWRIEAVTEQSSRKGERLFVFDFTAAAPPQPRPWRTDLLTNRLAGPQSRLLIRLGPPPQNLPILISFGGPDGRVDMKLER
ncbi:MAG: DUF3108 domain-containing protein [candidate division KSB1 bacterium]|nr:DUF3108 domain-containing protein [candidate division KSB1 bacterium]MDZ7345347.1 DUF3108 domain-containing protein [candidate division KSB1 bacterium]